ncbi:MAG: acetolactate synthase large subunit [Alphaproteobacteria bacterium]|nr:acetolactate synthase large subunit [Alphaproteobacteria bacterium]MBU1515326.1 acetolactate synthase large subunit [Alphaproteobacteria bacterium]MBU2095376.1 acetolactate synthase large subunit [Alphaproteobacteria bacterium]MBU2152604.1 acetolactate synthase large subunit [Alphaproteobacteria bacterium]MBU2310000.1 acetolactate synthase large subunit [Alphaproteobacteria bacterium]
MNGADALISTLVANDVTACFANPGTSEMQFVAALDGVPAMRPVLCQFEGVATGAADGYGRIADKPACTLLHLGPGYGNGVANLHNARRAYTPIVNVIGDHATYHRQYDAPLNSDIATLVKPNSIWAKSADTPESVSGLAAEAVAASFGPPGGPVSLILPADAAWLPASGEPVIAQIPVRPAPAGSAVDAAARAIKAAKKPVILLGGQAVRAEALKEAARLQAAGVTIYTDTFVARQPRGAGGFAPKKMQYFGEMALAELEGVDLMVYAGTTMPVAFFAYPNRPSVLIPEGCESLTLAERGEDAVAGLAALADALGAPKDGPSQALALPDAAPAGKLTAYAVGASIARHMPEGAIICDDAVTSGAGVAATTATARPHEVLALTGGAIGIGLPIAIGAAVAAPDRKVLSLNGDGAAMYTVQALWTMAREDLDITVVVFANHTYRILNIEMQRTGAGEAGPSARKLLDLGDPKIEWVQIARGMGLPAVRCTSAEDFERAFEGAMGQRGPMFIEAAI